MVPKDSKGSTSEISSTTSDPVVPANPNCAETFASLCLYGDALVPAQITTVLGLDPTDAAPKGERTTSSSGKSRTAPTGRWILESQEQVHSTNLEDHVAWLLDRIEAAGVVPLTLPGVSRASIFCYWASATGNGGPSFSATVLGRLARMQFPLEFDLYFPADTASA